MNSQQTARVAKEVASMLCGMAIVGVQVHTGDWNLIALIMAAIFLGVPTATNLGAFLALLSGNPTISVGGSDTPVSSSPSQQPSRSQSSSSSSQPRSSSGDDDESA